MGGALVEEDANEEPTEEDLKQTLEEAIEDLKARYANADADGKAAIIAEYKALMSAHKPAGKKKNAEGEKNAKGVLVEEDANEEPTEEDLKQNLEEAIEDLKARYA